MVLNDFIIYNWFDNHLLVLNQDKYIQDIQIKFKGVKCKQREDYQQQTDIQCFCLPQTQFSWFKLRLKNTKKMFDYSYVTFEKHQWNVWS